MSAIIIEQNVHIVLTIAGPQGGIEWFRTVIDDATSEDGYLWLEDVVAEVGAARPHAAPPSREGDVEPALLWRERCIEERSDGVSAHASYEYWSNRSLEADLCAISRHLPWIGFLYSQQTSPEDGGGHMLRQSSRIYGGVSSSLDKS